MRTSDEYKKLSIQEFDKAASIFGTDNAGIYKMCEKDYPYILEELEKIEFDSLLDAGCGNAPMLTLLKEKWPDKEYMGIDISQNMIDKAKERNLENVDFVVGDCENLPFEKETFDVIINSQSFHHYPNPEDFLKSAFNVLKNNGTLILRDNTSNNILIWLVNHIEMPIANIFGHGDVRIYSIDEMKELVEDAGFKIIKLEKQDNFRLHLVARKEV